MRRNVLPSMLDTISNNCNSRVLSGRLFEIAREFIPQGDELPLEKDVISVGYFGQGEDFYTIKNTLQALFDDLYVDAEYVTERNNPSFHTGRCAKVVANGIEIGVVGEVHPLVCEAFDISVRAYVALIDLKALLNNVGGDRVYKALPKFPAVTRDLSLVCDEVITSGEIIDIIRASANYLEAVSLFDIFRSEKIGENKKSISYKLVLRSKEGTLTDVQADESVSKVLVALENKGITLRK